MVAAEAAKREANVIANIHSGTVELILKQQLEQASVEVERAQQEVENWKGNFIYWDDKATQAEERIEELNERLAASGRRSGAETRTFSEMRFPTEGDPCFFWSEPNVFLGLSRPFQKAGSRCAKTCWVRRC